MQLIMIYDFFYESASEVVRSTSETLIPVLTV